MPRHLFGLARNLIACMSRVHIAVQVEARTAAAEQVGRACGLPEEASVTVAIQRAVAALSDLWPDAADEEPPQAPGIEPATSVPPVTLAVGTQSFPGFAVFPFAPVAPQPWALPASLPVSGGFHDAVGAAQAATSQAAVAQGAWLGAAVTPEPVSAAVATPFHTVAAAGLMAAWHQQGSPVSNAAAVEPGPGSGEGRRVRRRR